MEREEFSKLVKSISELTDFGMYDKYVCRKNKQEYPPSQELLLSDEGFTAFRKCLTWLNSNCIPTKTVSQNSPSSRTIQQIAKRPDYVSNGAMIAAIICAGYPYKIQHDSPNVLVGVSRKSPCFKNGPAA